MGLKLILAYLTSHLIVLYFFTVYLNLMKPGFGFIGDNIKNAVFNCATKIVYKNKFLTSVANKRLMRMADEEERAIEAAGKDENGDSIFGKIVRKEIKADIVYEDDKVLAFNDINPQAPVHILVIPKVRDGLTRLSKAEEKHKEILGHLMWAVSEIVRRNNLGDFRLVVNNGPEACQSVYYLHLHILAKRQMKWPPG
ncbi:protein kinase c inhibitor-like protein, putative [Plasmodium vinckei vinckei]|uniref:Protein kinase c inhibitor-like protein, putative n=2 Tax=Plasmodium vinckei vinckei TaxID=54757 RepID=A0A449BQQ6_PLAVN|nr:protein kinase c inhibitor-like protein, putative [Plasmodium vinckei vinckei]VEV55755.1 protein kinase c inhibitor-like protein, putative [Plasmodium vinckei vinckei]